MTNHVVIQEFRPMRSNDFVVASNTAHSKHEHRRSFLHLGQQALITSITGGILPLDHRRNVTASVTINHVSLSLALRAMKVVYRIVGGDCQTMGLSLPDECGFESYSLEWPRCDATLRGIIDPA
jgi:hypothetical protein